MDLRSSMAWSQFDEAIGHFGGKSAAAHAEPAVASVDGLSDGECLTCPIIWIVPVEGMDNLGHISHHMHRLAVTTMVAVLLNL